MSGTQYPSPEFQSLGIAVAAPASGVLGDFSNGSVTATGSTTARNLATRAAVFANALDFGADPTGAADSSSALIAALATGHDVYVPAGTYYIKQQLTVGLATSSQALFGAGLSTTFVIDDQFAPAATCIFLLQGTAQYGPRIHDIRIAFTQPQGASSRSTFAPLGTGTSHAGGTGVQYPPAILWGTGATPAGRFRLERIRVEGAWNGFAQSAAATGGGGFTITDIEMGALNCGLLVTTNVDFSRVTRWHNWNFGFNTTSLSNIYMDGNTIAIQAAPGGSNQCQSIAFTDIQNFSAQVILNSGTTSPFFSNLMMDGDCANITVNGASDVQISNLYFSVSSTGPANGLPCLWVTGAASSVFVSQLYGWCGQKPLVQIDNGVLEVRGGYVQSGAGINFPIIMQNAGWLHISNVEIAPDHSAAWTTASPVTSNGGILMFHDNIFTVLPVTGSRPGLAIAGDSGYSVVKDNSFTGWSFTPPGQSGLYGPNNLGLTTTGVGARSQGVNAQLTSWYGTAAPYTASATMINVDSSGNVHLGAQSAGVIIDSVPFTTVGAVGMTLGNNGPTIRSGAGAATGTQPAGSLWLRTDGSAGARLYVSAGAGTWAAVAGV